MSDIKPLLTEVLPDGSYQVLDPKDPRNRLGTPVTGQVNPVTGRIELSAGDSSLVPAFGRRLTLFGDSHSFNHSGMAYPVTAHAGRGWWNWYNFFTGHRLTIVRNAGVAGQTLAQIALRVETDLDPYPQDVISFLGGTNDVLTGRSSTQMISDWLVCVDKLRKLGCKVHCFTIPPITSTYAGYSAGWVAIIMEFNAFVKYYCERTPNFFCTDLFSILVDYSSASANPLANTFASADVHMNNYGAYLVGAQMATECSALYQPRTSSIACIADAFGSATSTGNYYTNSLFTVDSNTDGLADGISFAQISGLPTAVHSLVARAGKGNWQQSVITSAAAGNRASIVRYGSSTQISAGDYVYAEVDVNITGASNLRNIGLTLQAVDGITNPIAHDIQRVSTTDVALPASFSGTLRTPIIQVGAAGPMSIEADIYTEFSAAGGCTLQINGLQVRKVNPLLPVLD